jgi:hypothetical protein
MSAPQYVYIGVRRPSRDGEDPGAIDEAWFTVKDDVVQLVDRDGKPLQGEFVRRPIGQDETAREVAVRLLRTRSRIRPARPFNRPLRYPAIRF